MCSYNCLKDSASLSRPLLTNLLERKAKKNKMSYLKQSLPDNVSMYYNERRSLFKQVSEIKWEVVAAQPEKKHGNS